MRKLADLPSDGRGSHGLSRGSCWQGPSDVPPPFPPARTAVLEGALGPSQSLAGGNGPVPEPGAACPLADPALPDDGP